MRAPTIILGYLDWEHKERPEPTADEFTRADEIGLALRTEIKRIVDDEMTPYMLKETNQAWPPGYEWYMLDLRVREMAGWIWNPGEYISVKQGNELKLALHKGIETLEQRDDGRYVRPWACISFPNTRRLDDEAIVMYQPSFVDPEDLEAYPKVSRDSNGNLSMSETPITRSPAVGKWARLPGFDFETLKGLR